MMLPRRVTAVFFGLVIGLGLGGVPMALVLMAGSAVAQTEPAVAESVAEALSDSEALAQADQQVESAIEFLDHEAPISLIQSSVANLDRNFPYEHLSLAPIYGLLGYPAEGLVVVERAIATSESSEGGAFYLPNILVEQAELYYQLGRYEDAIASAQKVLALGQAGDSQLGAFGVMGDDSITVRALHQLGRSYLALGNGADAIATLTEAVSKTESSYDSLVRIRIFDDLALAYEAQGDEAQAAKAREQASQLQADLAEYFNWDLTALGSGQPLDPWEQSIWATRNAIADLQQAINTYHRLNQLQAEAKTRQYLGTLYGQLGLHNQAQDQFEQAIVLVTDGGSRLDQVDLQGSLALLTVAKGEYAQAQTLQTDVLNQYQAVGATQHTLDFLTQLSQRYASAQQWSEAADAYLRLLETADAAGLRNTVDDQLAFELQDVLPNLTYEANDAWGEHRLAEAEALLLKVLTIYGHLDPGDPETQRQEAYAANQLGKVYYDLGRYDQSEHYHQQALTLYQALGDPSQVADTWVNLGYAHYAVGQCAQGLEDYQQALTLYQQAEDAWGVADAENGLGICHESLGNYDQALTYYQSALAFYRSNEERSGESAMLINLGAVYDALGRYRDAIATYQQAIELKQILGDRAGEAYALINLGNTYNTVGQHSAAIAALEQALPMTQAASDRRSEGAALGNLGVAYSSLGQSATAIDYQEQSLAIAREIGDRSGEANTLNNLGSIYDDRDEHDEALNYYQQALTLAQTVQDRRLEGMALGNIGSVYNEQEKYDQALPYHQQQLTLTREIGDPRGEAAALHNLGISYFGLERYVEALEAEQAGLAIAHRISDRNRVAAILPDLAQAFIKQGQPEAAHESYQELVLLTQTLMAEQTALDASQKAAFLATFQEGYQQYADLLRSQNRAAEADQILQLLTPQ